MASTSLVTRSAAALEMDTPSQILIRPSKADPEKLGVWCKELIKEGTKFGPILGEKAYEVDECTDPAYIWEIVDVETKEFLFYINATKDSGNWMRHIKCARFFEEQNIVSEQEGIDIFYQAIKDISPGEELLTWFEKSPLRRKKGKRRVYQPLKRGKAEKTKPQNSQLSPGSSKADAYAGVNCISQRGRKRNVRKYWQMEDDSDANRDKEKPEESEEDLAKDRSDEEQKTAEVKPPAKVVEKPAEEPLPEESSTGFFQFELQVTQMGKNRLGRKVFQCDICLGIYRHGFSLKRHYIRNHINYKYVSKVDRLNCGITSDPRSRPEIEGSFGEVGEDEKVEGVKIEECAKEELEEDRVKKSRVESNSLKTKDSARMDSKIPNGDGMVAANAEHSLAKNDDTTTEDKARPSPCSTPSINGTVKIVAVEDNTESKGRFLLPGLYQCNICDKLYNTVDQLKEHILSHPKVPSREKFACQHCSMKFKYRQNLMRHEVVHTGAKPFTCNHCNKRFPTLTNQKRHERIHKGQKFTCPQCPGTFTQTGDLKKHVCKQHPETYNECGYCAKYFSSESILAGHLQKVHSKDVGANHQKICARRKARKVSLERDRAESRRLASGQAESHRSESDPSLQFACTVCRKRFRDYSNMCRHRRLAHEREASQLESQWGNLDDGSLNDGVGYFSDTDSQPDGDKVDALQVYFSGVSHNISNNLRNFIEGREEQLSRASSHIRWKQKNAAETLAETENAANINLEEFNFPHGFQIRQLSELYEASETKTIQTLDDEISPKNEPTCNNKCNGRLMTDKDLKSESSAVTEDDSPTKEKPCAVPLAIRVPEIRSCSVCHSSFHSTAALLSHISENHCHSKSDISGLSGDSASDCAPVNYSIKCQQPSDAPVQVVKPDCDEAPLDLSVPSTPDTAVNQPTLVSPVLNNVGETVTGCDEKIQCNTKKGAPTTPDKKYLCLVCFSEFVRLTDLSEHQREWHASVDCRHAEVDLNFNTTLFRRPTPVGALNVSSSQLPKPQENQSLTDSSCICTKCRSQFCSSELLHQHIADCGDYWRHLNNRVTWVFVLRGSEVPVEKAVKKRGKFHWSNSPEESSRKQLQRMLLQQHIGDDVVENSTGKGRFGRPVARTKSLESVDDDSASDLRRSRWRHGHQSAYNPRRHVRRREMAELVDVQKCRGCGEEFKTILQLERHIPVCTEKSRIKDLHSERAENGENSDEENDYDPNKHMCIYCERQFTYLRTLKKHIAENCPVRKEFIEQREYIDKEWEQEISSKVQGAGSRDSGQIFGETVAGEEGDSGLDSKRSKRRKRGNNWGCRVKTKKSFKSSRSSDDGDSLFGWEDAFLSTWSKKEGNRLKVNSGSIADRNNKGQNVHDIRRSGGGALRENINPNVDVSPALQKLLTSDFLSGVAGAEEEKLTTEEACLADTVSAPDMEEVNDCGSSLHEQGICKNLSPDVACSENLQTVGDDASTVNAGHVGPFVAEIHAEQTEGGTSDSKHGSDVVMQSSAVFVEEAVANANNTDNKNEIDCNHFELKELEQEQKELVQEQEEVLSVRARKRRGPRLTMKSKRRKPVVNKQKVKAQNN